MRSLADGGTGANRNLPPFLPLPPWSLADGGTGANRNNWRLYLVRSGA